MPAFDTRLTLGIAHAITSAYADRQSKRRYRKDLPLETRIQFPHLHANALKFGACGARREVGVACGYVGARDQNGCDLPLPRSTLELRAPEVIGGKARAGECFNLPADGRSAASDSQFRKISILFQATTSRPAWAGAGFR